MSTKSIKKEDDEFEIKERSEEELLEEEIRNQQTLDIFIESDRNWSWLKLTLEEIIMNLNIKSFLILNKERKELEYIKEVYMRRVQAEIDSYKDFEDEDRKDIIYF